ncbi:cyclin-A2 [Paramormyrops kingsleyae]|uniref:cyclin-A2 n=1 Tax=Paramormyrops kingsleyae TaxID=1676925 RepID=UPI003B9787DD
MATISPGGTDAVTERRNQENLPPGLRLAGKENREDACARPTTRTVLGALPQNNQRRRPPSQRAAKVAASKVSKNEDDCKGAVGSKQPPFQIHLDEPEVPKKQEPVRTKAPENALLPLHPAVTALRQPLAAIDIPMEVSFDSPMDMSIVDAEEKLLNVSQATAYSSEIHTYLREMELKLRPKAGYMKKQPDITSSMRAILVDWLVEVGEEYKLQNETLYLAVNYIDRFLSSMSVLRGKLQLVGTAAMLLASKFEEIYPPMVSEFVYITDDTYTKNQVLRMEHLVLKVLSFELAAPTINQFLTQYFLCEPVCKSTESLSMFLGELSLIDSDPFLKYLPSQMAAAAFTLAHYTVSGGSWTEPLEQVTGYTLEVLTPCIMDLHQTYLNSPRHAQQSVREKYKTSKYHKVSLIEPPEKLILN